MFKMGRRIVYIRKAENIDTYFIGEYVGSDNKTWKEQRVFQSPQEVINYLGNSDDKYAQELRGRRNLGIIVKVPNNEGDSLIKSLEGIKSRFDRIVIRKAPSNNH
jgi:hypothetical protein